MKVALGWVGIDIKSCKPYRSETGRSFWKRKNPPKIYTSAKRAAEYSNGGIAFEVYIDFEEVE